MNEEQIYYYTRRFRALKVSPMKYLLFVISLAYCLESEEVVPVASTTSIVSVQSTTISTITEEVKQVKKKANKTSFAMSIE